MEVKPLKTPRNDDSALIMISMAYAPRCEADRFAMRNDSFLRRNELNDLETAMRNRSFRYVANPFAFLLLDGWGSASRRRRRALLASLHRVQIMASLRMAVKKSCVKAQLTR